MIILPVMWYTHSTVHRLYEPRKMLLYASIVCIFFIQKSFGADTKVDSDLCNTDGDGSCFRQIPHQNLNLSDCVLTFHPRNSTECSSQHFDHVYASQNHLGTITINPYKFVYSTWRGTALNVTMSDIRWTYLRMRFMQIGNKAKNFCRDITLSRNVNLTDLQNLFYDCIWSLNDYEETGFDFEFELTNYKEKQSGHYKFKVPYHDCIKDVWTPYILVNIVKQNEFILNWLPHSSSNKYIVKVIQDSNVILTTYVHDLTYTFHAGFKSGIYEFSVQPKEFYGPCNEARTPKIKVESSFLTIITGTLMVALIFLCMLLLACVIRKRKQIFKIEKPPTILLIYSKSSTSHVKVINSLASYLKKWAHINVLIDEIDIPQYHKSDPLLWYTDMMTSADWVVVTSSPSLCQTSSFDIGVYQHTDCLALRLLGPRLIQEGKAVTLLLPYCAKSTDIPPEARALTRYYFPSDLRKLIWHLHFRNRGCWVDYFLLKNMFPDVNHIVSREAKDLLAAISVAEASITRVNKDHFSAINRNVNHIQLPEKNEVNKALEQIVQLNNMEEIEKLLPESIQFKPVERYDKVYSDIDFSGTFPGNIHEMDLLGDQNNKEKCKVIDNNTDAKFNINQLSL